MAVFFGLLLFLRILVVSVLCDPTSPVQQPLLAHSGNDTTISTELFEELEELARIVDIAYCVGTAGLGIQKPFQCLSRCGEFENFELVKTWNTGPLLSDSCGYIVLSHPPSPPRIILAFRGTYSIANTIVDLSTVPQAYVPYPGDDKDTTPSEPKTPGDVPGEPDGEDPPPAHPPKCDNCTVHTGFYSSWLNTRHAILSDVTEAIEKYPDYRLTLVGHSLGGAVAALAGLDFKARGWDPRVTTFGEPRIGNKELNAYLNERFNITSDDPDGNKYHRVTHIGDPVPLLPLEEWGYSMHGEEIYISQPALPPSVADIHYCHGDEDPACIHGSDRDAPAWGVPTRFKFWNLFFAHRDYFWRIGLCVPSGGLKDWISSTPEPEGSAAELELLENNEL
ncbi:lipase precursor [Sporormia fimetaria CBS 119925]|uniref:Lipase n=1 Tax=Sporormia fimetaria CBS 119925 TaxID=1340428 RepID=A0A6A6VGT7_9PLEO|nr:lipase precursor [Sporormia fimetaria CBS 119925]